VTEPSFDRGSWETRWENVRREHPDAVANRPPNEHLLRDLADLPPGTALDAGCGHGAESLWLAAAGWQVTAVDFSRTALDLARPTAQSLGDRVAGRVDWVEADLGSWNPPADAFDLVACLYVHVAGSVGELVARLASGVAPGGTLFLVGHLPVDPATGAPTPASGQRQVTVEEAISALDAQEWDVLVSEERRRSTAGSGVDAVVRAVRRG
jgi:SAM-dependent methyltransferase